MLKLLLMLWLAQSSELVVAPHEKVRGPSQDPAPIIIQKEGPLVVPAETLWKAATAIFLAQNAVVLACARWIWKRKEDEVKSIQVKLESVVDKPTVTALAEKVDSNYKETMKKVDGNHQTIMNLLLEGVKPHERRIVPRVP